MNWKRGKVLPKTGNKSVNALTWIVWFSHSVSVAENLEETWSIGHYTWNPLCKRLMYFLLLNIFNKSYFPLVTILISFCEPSMFVGNWNWKSRQLLSEAWWSRKGGQNTGESMENSCSKRLFKVKSVIHPIFIWVGPFPCGMLNFYSSLVLFFLQFERKAWWQPDPKWTSSWRSSREE